MDEGIRVILIRVSGDNYDRSRYADPFVRPSVRLYVDNGLRVYAIQRKHINIDLLLIAHR